MKCEVLIEKDLMCGHKIEVACHLNTSEHIFTCQYICTAVLGRYIITITSYKSFINPFSILSVPNYPHWVFEFRDTFAYLIIYSLFISQNFRVNDFKLKRSFYEIKTKI